MFNNSLQLLDLVWENILVLENDEFKLRILFNNKYGNSIYIYMYIFIYSSLIIATSVTKIFNIATT